VAEFESVACEICGSDARRELVRRADLLLGGDRVYFMHECLGCGAIYQHPRPKAAAMAAFYPPEYIPYTPSLREETWRRRLDRRFGLRKRCRLILRHVKQGRLLDVGCATGDFLSEMRRRPGWSLVGLEPNHAAARFAHLRVGLEIVEGLLNEAAFADESFDVITMWDVLEHVYDPPAVIRAAARLLRHGGILVINHPNLASVDRRLFGRFWCGYELPRHLYLYPADLLRRMMAEHGLQEAERRCFYGSHSASATSLAFIAEAYLGKGRISRIARRLFFNMCVRLLLVPYFKLIDHYRRGSNVTVVFKRG
jgi:2-polyprenyl-3-methyl-5-hydroxy-6-metoxy-1,4-benzoquinol methylase